LRLILVIKLIRVHQYIKNLFIFLPLFFAAKITELDLLFYSLISFIAFSLTASAIYIINDYFDIDEDKQHPIKKKRPLASSEIEKSHAIIVSLLLLISGFSLMSFISYSAVGILALYVVLNFAYSYSLKHVSILDVNIIAIGFVLRLFIGSIATDILLSKWIIIMTFLLALFMALAKRRDDVLIFQKTGIKLRKVIDGYNLQFIDSSMIIMASSIIVTYTLYTTSIEVQERFDSEYLYLTVFFVVLGILRYLKITFVNENSYSPTMVILKDSFIQLILVGWALIFTLIIY
jgi:decaprenyl-phosphate phosphoribosyltransferase